MHKDFSSLEKVLRVKKYPSPEERMLFEKTQDFVKIIRWIPGIRMVAVSNSLAMYTTHSESDIDLFIITAPRRLWIVRTLVLLLATVLFVRAKPWDEAGKFCFPFFMTEKYLSLKNIALKNDVYLEYWIRTLKPILVHNYTYGRFMKINAPDMREEVLEQNRQFILSDQRTVKIEPRFIEELLDMLEKTLKALSLPKVFRQINSLEVTEGIVITDDMLKLHFNDRRREIRESLLWD